MSFLIAIAIKPFVALVLLLPVYMLVGALDRRMPDSALKRFLFSPLPGHRCRRG